MATCLRAGRGAAIAGKTVPETTRGTGISRGIRRETDCHRLNTYGGKAGETSESVIGRGFRAGAPWEEAGTDATEPKRPWGKARFAPTCDFGSKETVAWPTSPRPDMAQQPEPLGQLPAKRPEGSAPMPHSDMGWQYQHASRCGRLRAAGIVQSMPRKGNRIGNGATEQAFGHLKDESFRNQTWPSFEEFRRDLDAYVVHWNARRR